MHSRLHSCSLGILTLTVVMGLLLLTAHTAKAHQSSDSFLTLNIGNKNISGQWAISVRDLDLIAGLDLNRDGLVTWGEIRTQEQLMQSLVASHLLITSRQQHCKLSLSSVLTDYYSDGAYIIFPLNAQCDQPIARAVTISYTLLFNIDTQHRGLLKLTNGNKTGNNIISAVFRPDDRERSFTVNNATAVLDNKHSDENDAIDSRYLTLQQVGSQLWDFILHGIWHIWIGIDHILFLLTLLLPAVLVCHKGQWQGVTHWHDALRDTIKIVTAFTLAHSITLGLATTGLIALPTRWVEIAIAASVIITAINNIYPFLKTSRWVLTFVFGLIHGLGFAAVLGKLSLGTAGLFTSLLGFNIGVEIGQLVIVAAWFPIAYSLRATFVYRQLIYKYGSSVIAVVAGFWLYERIVIY